MTLLVAALTAGFMTLFDLDRTFYVPSTVGSRAKLLTWWWGFVLFNAVLAAATYEVMRDAEFFNGWHPLAQAVTCGFSYLALIRLKVTTLTIQGKEIPFGFDAGYEAAKSFVFKRINNIAKEARFQETTALAGATSLADLLTRAKLAVEQDQLIAPEEKRDRKAWLLRVAADGASSDMDKRAILADYILSGLRSSDIA